MPDTVLPLDDPVASVPSVSGGKGATLSRLRALDLPVPDGVVVTTETYRRLVDDDDVRASLATLEAAVERGDVDGRAAAAATVRAAIRARPLPADAVAALDRTLPDGPLAVRSSATTEDLPGASFAGQYETRLGVAGREACHAAVVACAASLYTDRAVAYRVRTGRPATGALMAVVVQRLIEPDVSGVLFTADPVTGDRRLTVVDAAPGGGDALVSGRTAADAARFDARRGVVDYRVATGRSEPVLADRDVAALAAVGKRVADALGGPQDVEWAIRDGDVSILQSRPVTALFPVPEPTSMPTAGATRVYYSFGHRQGMPDAMPTLVLDCWCQLIDVVRARFGLPDSFAATAGGRLYLDLTPYLAVPVLRERVRASLATVDEPTAAAIDALLAQPETTIAATPPSPSGYRRGLRAAVRTWRGLVPGVGALPRALLASNPETTLARIRADYDLGCERALRAVRTAETPLDRVTAAYDAIVAAPSWLLGPFYPPFVAGTVAGAVLRRCYPTRQDRVDDLALGIADDAVFRMTTALGDVADVARESPAVAAALRDGASLDDLDGVDGADRFRRAFEAFLDEYSFRGVGEIDWSRPRYGEDPTPLLHVVAAAVGTGAADEDGSDPLEGGVAAGGPHRRTAAQLEARADEAVRVLVGAAPLPARPLVRRLAAAYRTSVGVREHPKFALARLLAALRSATLDAGEALVAAGALADADDVWFLAFDELRAGLDDPRALAGVDVAARRREFERFERLVAPRVLTGHGAVPRGPAPSDDGRSLRGTGVAPGVVEGVVRVVTDPGRDRLDRGEVLVAPYTDPGWTPLFLNAAAVVTEVGGRLTHGSLVAREFGIPAVAAVEGATTRLHTGDRVRVDGAAGVVERLDRSTATRPGPEPRDRSRRGATS